MKLTILIPVYNGANTISELTEGLIKNLKQYDLEIVLVNDGSADNSHEVCLSIFEKYKDTVKYIKLAKNYGEHNAVMAGLNSVEGHYVVVIDDDFQNPPEEIQKLVDKTMSGNFDVVYSFYDKKQHSWFRNMGSRFNDILANILLDKPRDLYLSSFKCMNSFVVKEVIKYKGPFPYVDGLILRCTRNIGKVLVEHKKREEGRSGYTLRKLVRLWLNMFVNFSIYPLRLSILLGFTFLFIGVTASIWILIDKILDPSIPMGVTSILMGILIFGGIQLLILGVIGEYLGKLYLTDNQTPQYTIRNIYEKGTKG